MVRLIKKFAKLLVVIFFIFTVGNSILLAQDDTTKKPEFFKLSFEDLSENIRNIEEKELVSIATQTKISIKETPGIVTVISKEDIEQSGAQDLMELLKLIPGIDFGSDVQNVIGISIRGNWAFEGKILITIDGQMINETSYGTFAFGQRILLDNIEKVEIIRGPGSAIYGGVAGLAVINIITKKIQGFQSSHSLSFTNGKSRQNTQFQMGKSLENNVSFSVSGSYNKGNLSNSIIKSPSNNTINYGDSSGVESYFFNTTFQYKQLILRYIFNDYTSNIIESAGNTKFGGHLMNVQYTHSINSTLSLTPQIYFSSHKPWDLLNVPDNNYNLTNSRITGKLQLLYQPSSTFSLVSGIEGFHDRSTITTAFSENSFNNGKPSLDFDNLAVFNQAILNFRIVNLTAGIRMDAHSAFGVAFSPRIAITRQWNKFHAKMLYSNAFKAPTLQNIDANPEIKPERIYTGEFEVGYDINKRNTVTANLFYININNEIIYNAIDDIVDHYENGTGTGTAGSEISYKANFSWGSLSSDYSYYSRIRKNTDLVEDDNILLKPIFASHKVILQGSFKIKRNFILNASGIFLSKRHSYISINGESKITTLPQSFLANINFNYKNLLMKSLSGYLGINNLFNSSYSLVHPYETDESPIPSQGRELFLKLSFNFNN